MVTKVSKTPNFKCYDLVDLDFDLLDPGIRKTVEWLVDMGFETTDSGDGKHKGQWLGEADYMSQPNVFMQTTKNDLIEEADRLHKLLIFHHRIILDEATHDQQGPHVQALFDPSDDSAIIALYNIDDSMLFEPACRAAAEGTDQAYSHDDTGEEAPNPNVIDAEFTEVVESTEPPPEATGC